MVNLNLNLVERTEESIMPLMDSLTEEEITMHLDNLYAIIEDTNDSTSKCEYDTILCLVMQDQSKYSNVLKYLMQ